MALRKYGIRRIPRTSPASFQKCREQKNLALWPTATSLVDERRANYLRRREDESQVRQADRTPIREAGGPTALPCTAFQRTLLQTPNRKQNIHRSKPYRS